MDSARRIQHSNAAASKTILTLDQYEELRRRLLNLTGIELGDNKFSLVGARLFKRLSDLKLTNFSDYINHLQTHKEETAYFVNCLTTHKTDWFREPQHFNYLVNNVIPKLQHAKRTQADKTILIWSAACSSGEEVYTLAMSLHEKFRNPQEFKILGTDIDVHVLSRAMAGVYSSHNVKSQVPAPLVDKYFEELNSRQSSDLKVNAALTENIKFRHHNLIDNNIPSHVKFDVIFLRNVLIYFSLSTREKVINQLTRNLNPGGYIFIGHSESLTGINTPLVQVSEAVYKLEIK